MNLDLRFYLSVFLRRLHYFAFVAIVLTAAGISAALVMPTRYEAEALLLVESAQIPDELAASTVRTNAAEQLQIMEQRLLTRNNLLDIANELNVFPNRATMFADQVVDAMRENTTFRISTGRDRASLFRIGFSADRPEITAAVVNAYVSRVLADNIELRTSRAEDTQQFFEQEVNRLAEDLARQSAEILNFKNANINALPENLKYQLERLDDLRDRINEIDAEIALLGQQRERLILVFNATGSTTQGGVDQRSPQERELEALKNELTRALGVYSEQNPQVKVLRNRIAALEAQIEQNSTASTDGTGDDTGGGENATPSILDVQLREVENRVESLQDQRAAIEPEIERLVANVEATQGNAIALDSLERRYKNIQDQYNDAVARSATASTGERIELLSKGERISVINQPVVPRTPSSPNRPLIAGAGMVAGIGAGLGLVILLELLNRSIRRPVDLTRSLGITPLGALPLIRTPREVLMRRVIVVSVILVGTVGIVGSVYYVHEFIRPLDLIAKQIVDRFGA